MSGRPCERYTLTIITRALVTLADGSIPPHRTTTKKEVKKKDPCWYCLRRPVTRCGRPKTSRYKHINKIPKPFEPHRLDRLSCVTFYYVGKPWGLVPSTRHFHQRMSNRKNEDTSGDAPQLTSCRQSAILRGISLVHLDPNVNTALPCKIYIRGGSQDVPGTTFASTEDRWGCSWLTGWFQRAATAVGRSETVPVDWRTRENLVWHASSPPAAVPTGPF